MKILIFGGTFDPVHIGHETVVKIAQKKIKPDLTLIIPNKVPPLKEEKLLTRASDRLNMLKLAFENFKKTKVSSIELKKPGNDFSYTIDTIENLKKKYKKAKLYLLIGGDRFNDFSKWKRSDDIKNLIEKIVVISRKNVQLKKASKVIILSEKKIPISSMELRSKLEGKWLNKKVLNYIFENNLYVENLLLSLMSRFRYEHSKRVARTAVNLAKIHNKKMIKKAFVAGMFHDICKEFKNQEIEKIVGESGKNFPTSHTKHGLAGSIYLKNNFGLKDKEILNAIKDHVIPKNNSPLLTKIIYCADKLEPKRKNKKDVSNRRKYMKMARVDIDRAFSELLAETKKKHAH